MRELLFRAKSLTGEWVEGYFWHNHFGNYFIRRTYRPADGYFVIEDFEVDPETVEEFTGKYDENNVRIFENDMVNIFAVDDDKNKYIVSTGKVVYRDCCFGILYDEDDFVPVCSLNKNLKLEIVKYSYEG